MRFLGIEGGTIKDGMMGEAVKWLVANEAELRSAAPEGTEYLGPTPRYSHRTRIPGMSTSSMQWTPTERWIDKLLPQTLASANSLTNGAGSSTAHPERWAANPLQVAHCRHSLGRRLASAYVPVCALWGSERYYTRTGRSCGTVAAVIPH